MTPLRNVPSPTSRKTVCGGDGAVRGMIRMRGGGAVEDFYSTRAIVEKFGACSLPGCTIKYDTFMAVLRRAQSRGYVKDHEGDYVAEGLLHGFKLGVNFEVLRRNGRRIHRNYKSAYDNHTSVSSAVRARLCKGKTISLGPADIALAELSKEFTSLACFPMGAVLKPNQDPATPPDQLVYRPTSDHTKTGFNAATVLGILGHSLNTYKEVEWLLKLGYFMRVSDVEDAFMLIPLHPDVWLYMFFRWSLEGRDQPEDLYLHLFGDFGTRGMPGTFQLFLVRVVVQMARSELVLTLPLTVFVDDGGLIGPVAEDVDSEMESFQDWSTRICGVPWKRPKDRLAATPQYYIGFWWDSVNLTRCLSEEKLSKYLCEIAEAASARSLTLRERQSLAGKMQRAIMTLPPGAACLLVNCYRMMSGLLLPWHARRTTQAEREDYQFVHDCLKYVDGKGYYSYDGFAEGPTVLSDASKSRECTAGGYVDSHGHYDWWRFGTSAARKPIDYLEGETVLQACRDRGEAWRGCQIPFGCDNQAFELSAERGRSQADRLNSLLKELFVLQIRHGFVLQMFWISTVDNFLADHLSRAREAEFLSVLPSAEFLVVPFSELKRHPGAGRTLTLSSHRDPGMAALRQLTEGYSSNNLRDGPNRGAGVGGDAQLLSISYPTTTIWDGLPAELEEEVDEVMDNRLAESSRAKVMTSVNRWSTFCASRGWSPILVRGNASRGGRMVAWVMQMTRDTSLVFKSISTYVWGVRTWHVLQHQPDPCFGVMFWREFMGGISVLTAVPGEPRRMFPLETFRAVMADLDPTDLRDANFGLTLLTLLFTFSRTECPCPKSWTGQGAFDAGQHWTVDDFRLVKSPDGVWVLWVRFKKIKQDPRKERPSIGGPQELPFEDDSSGVGHDWVPIGDLPDDPLFSISAWYMAFVRAMGRKRPPNDPMFVAKDGKRSYTYTCLRADLYDHLTSLGLDGTLTPHCIRVLGYNLSKRGNGVEITVAHGGWMSEAHDRYERFSNKQLYGIPAGMLQVSNPFGGESQRAIHRARASRYPDGAPPEPGSDGDEPEGGTASAGPAGALPDGYSEELRETTAGRVYPIYHGPDGRVARSRAEAWRQVAELQDPDDAEGEAVAVDTADSSDGAEGAVAVGAADSGAAALYEPFTVFDIASPAGQGQGSPAARRERLSAMARRLRSERASPQAESPALPAEPTRCLPFGASYVEVEVCDEQCGNPNCIVKSRNGRHAGAHVFREPPPRR